MARYDDDDDDYDDDRPRRSSREDRPRKRSRKKSKGGAPVGPMIAVGIVVGVVVVAGLVFAFRGGSADKNKSGEAKSGDPAAAAGVAANAPGTPVGTKYVPRESEKKLEEFLKAQADRIVTDEEVFAIMGEPTRRDAAQTGRKNGQVFTIYTAHWEAPDGSIRSQISFANGRVAGIILGLETKPRK